MSAPLCPRCKGRREVVVLWDGTKEECAACCGVGLDPAVMDENTKVVQEALAESAEYWAKHGKGGGK